MVDDYEFTSQAHHHIMKMGDGTKLWFTPEWVDVKKGKKTVRQRNGSSYLATTKAEFDELWARGYRSAPKASGGKKPKWTGEGAPAPKAEDPKE